MSRISEFVNSKLLREIMSIESRYNKLVHEAHERGLIILKTTREGIQNRQVIVTPRDEILPTSATQLYVEISPAKEAD